MKNNKNNLVIANKVFKSRLIIGTGKYSSYKINQKALEASGAEISRWYRSPLPLKK